ncbi:MAG: hypothetical protein PHR00_01150 [Patescibacteria group bacterium]|nr:hypothetical protein [Patescibacteria group bacterium]
MKKNKSGYTLIEIISVLGIAVLLIVISAAGINAVRGHSRDAKRLNDIQELSSALSMYRQETGFYPVKITAGEKLVTPGGKVILNKIPTPPLIKDGPCAPGNYEYEQIDNGRSYSLKYCLGYQVNRVNPGNCYATPQSICSKVAKTCSCQNKCGGILDNCGNPCNNPCSYEWVDVSKDVMSATSIKSLQSDELSDKYGSFVIGYINDKTDLMEFYLHDYEKGWIKAKSPDYKMLDFSLFAPNYPNEKRNFYATAIELSDYMISTYLNKDYGNDSSIVDKVAYSGKAANYISGNAFNQMVISSYLREDNNGVMLLNLDVNGKVFDKSVCANSGDGFFSKTEFLKTKINSDKGIYAVFNSVADNKAMWGRCLGFEKWEFNDFNEEIKQIWDLKMDIDANNKNLVITAKADCGGKLGLATLMYAGDKWLPVGEKCSVINPAAYDMKIFEDMVYITYIDSLKSSMNTIRHVLKPDDTSAWSYVINKETNYNGSFDSQVALAVIDGNPYVTLINSGKIKVLTTQKK